MRPLENINILSLAINIPGPVAAARLRDWGAAVTKIEPPTGDPLKLISPKWYGTLHDGLTVLNLNLKSASGQEQLAALLAETDLLLTSLRPAALERLGLAWPSLASQYPRLCQVAIIGYPPPAENQAGHDLTYRASVGLLDPPHMPQTVMIDLAGAERAAAAALALLLGRERGGGSAYFEVALSAAADAFAQPLAHGLTAPDGALGGGLPVYNLYRAQEGWVAVAALEAHFWDRLAAALGVQAVTQSALAEAFAERPAAFWEAWALEHDLPLAAVKE